MSAILRGCADDSSSEESPEEAETSEAEGNDEMADDGNYGGTLKVAFSNQPPTLDIPQTTATVAREISHMIYEPLVTLDSSLEVEPMLAESYDISDDGDVITFHLRKDIKFHNGEEMTSEDVVASMERWQEFSSAALTYLEGTEYEIVDEHTIEAHIADPT